MGSLLDIHKYSKTAFQHLYDKLTDAKFQKPYVVKDYPINAVTGVLWDITQEDSEIVKIISEMDKIDNIRAERNISKLEKITSTWIKKAYRVHLENGYKISKSLYLKFIKNIMNPNSKENEEKLLTSAKKMYDKIYVAYKMRQNRIQSSDKLDELKNKYPKLNIEKAFRYAVVSGKFNLNADDIEDFEYLAKFLVSPKEEIKKEKLIVKK